MTAPTQGDVRTWARSQGMTVNARGSLPTSVVAAYSAAHGSPTPAPTPVAAPAPQPTTGPVAATSAALPDLAAALQSLLAEVDAEVDAVSSLSDSIDALVSRLNAARQEQAARLIALDELQSSVEDPSLGAFLHKTIRPRRTKVAEVVPDRLR